MDRFNDILTVVIYGAIQSESISDSTVEWVGGITHY